MADGSLGHCLLGPGGRAVLPNGARSSGEMPYTKAAVGRMRDADGSGSVEGTAGQSKVKGCRQLLARGGRALGNSVFQTSECWLQPASDPDRLDIPQTVHSSSACSTAKRSNVRVKAMTEERKTQMLRILKRDGSAVVSALNAPTIAKVEENLEEGHAVVGCFKGNCFPAPGLPQK